MHDAKHFLPGTPVVTAEGIGIVRGVREINGISFVTLSSRTPEGGVKISNVPEEACTAIPFTDNEVTGWSRPGYFSFRTYMLARLHFLTEGFEHRHLARHMPQIRAADAEYAAILERRREVLLEELSFLRNRLDLPADEKA